MLTSRSLLLAASPLRLLGSPKKPPRKSDIQFRKITSSRQEGAITYEGDLKVTGEKPVAGLILHIEFLDTEGILLTQQKIETTEETLTPGMEKHFAVRGNDVPRAVSFRLSATDRTGRDLSTDGSGPYPLD
jgi:hypothetical protein